MPFIPATPGIVGFGGGSKPAIFQAVAPQYSLMNQQTDDEDFRSCHDVLGDDLDVAISGILTCDACYTINAGGGDQDVKFTLTGLNGVFTAVWDAISSRWQAVIGTVTVTTYSSSDGTCTTELANATGDITLLIQCTKVLLTALALGNALIDILVFINNTGALIGAPLNSVLVLGDCGTGTPPSFTGAYGGTMTITVPP